MVITDKEAEFLFQNDKFLYKGIIEDNNDPLQMARYRIRILGIHSQNTTLVPTNTLPWAVSINPLVFGFDQGVGISSVAQVNTWVWCTFDNNDVNSPIILGTIVGGSDINSKVKANYLNNHIIETKSGHYVELNDSGIIKINHSSGSNINIDIDGNISITSKNNTLNVDGNVTITATGTGNIASTGAMTLQGSSVTIIGGSTMVV